MIAGATDTVERLADKLDVSLDSMRQVVVVDSNSTSTPTVEAATRVARDMGIPPVVSTYDGQVVFLPDRQLDWYEMAARFSSKRQCAWRLGVGDVVERHQLLGTSLHQANVALRVGRALDLPRITFFNDLGVYALVASETSVSELGAFIDHWLGRLIAYDAEHHIELLRTLERYLELGGALDKVSAALFVHRSTLKYRLRRIREITAYDLADPDTRFNLHFAPRTKASSTPSDRAARRPPGQMTVSSKGWRG